MEPYQIAIIIVLILFILFYNYHRNSYNLYSRFKDLWLDYVFWMREYIISYYFIQSNVDASLERLIQVQHDICNFISYYHGNTIGSTITDLFKEHINLLPMILNSLQSSVETHLTESKITWSENIEKISIALSTMLKSDRKYMSDILQKNLDLIIIEAESIKNREFIQSQKNTEEMIKNIKVLSDYLSGGIVSHNTACMIYTIW